jgi:Kef-type K+ transport system membrane component KefB/Trk K+ transport system NAD-binding subunit
MIEGAFSELGIILLIAILVTIIIRALKQPLIIGYIITGILISPHVLNIVSMNDSVATFSNIGVALLLFLVGLNLNPKIIKDVGKVSLFTGLGQVLFTTCLAFFITRAFGFSLIVSGYVAVAVSFSSTIIIMKLLSDKGDTESLYGRIAIGFLIVQDLIAVLILIVISSTSNGMDFATLAFETIFKGLLLMGILYLIGVYILPKLIKSIAKSQEFLLLFSIGWCMVTATFFYIMGFSLEIGALFAGFLLSFSPYRFEIGSKLKPLRDFFLVLFFILLGSELVFSNVMGYILPIIILSLIVLIGNPLIVMFIMGFMGYTKKNSFLAGLTVAQISEFSLILIALGVKLNHLSIEILSMMAIIALITIAGSTYFIMYANKIYPKISGLLSIFEKKGNKIDEHKYHKHKKYDIILFGYNRTGYDLMEAFKRIRKKFLVIDYNPEIIIQLAREGINCIYGDASDLDLLNEINFKDAKMIVSTIRDLETDLLLIKKIRECNKKSIIIAVAHQIDESLLLYDEGATYVIMPHFLGGHHTATMIEEYGFDATRFLENKIAHIEHLKSRKEMGHDHPKHDQH